MTQLVIISEIHLDKVNYSSRDLCKILEKVSPDLILVELDKSYFDESYELIKDISDWQAFDALRQYKNKHTVKIRPFDIENRNDFYRKTDYFSKRKKFSQLLSTYAAKDNIPQHIKLHLDILNSFSQLQDVFLNDCSEVINSQAFDKFTELRNEFMYHRTLSILKETPYLQDHYDFWKLVCDEWDKRNKAMTANILSIMKEFPQNRIAVIVGAAHKYYLKKELLAKQNKLHFIINEFWDIN